jgi:hypothetical protein
MTEETTHKITGCPNYGCLRFAVFEHLTSFCTLDSTGALVQDKDCSYESDITAVRCVNCDEEYEIDYGNIHLQPIAGLAA